MAQFLQVLAEQLTDSPAHDWALSLLRASPAVSPLAQAAHIVGFSIVVGVSGMIALRVLGLESLLPGQWDRAAWPAAKEQIVAKFKMRLPKAFTASVTAPTVTTFLAPLKVGIVS